MPDELEKLRGLRRAISDAAETAYGHLGNLTILGPVQSERLQADFTRIESYVEEALKILSPVYKADTAPQSTPGSLDIYERGAANAFMRYYQIAEGISTKNRSASNIVSHIERDSIEFREMEPYIPLILSLGRYGLTAREMQTLEMIHRGLSRKQIAEEFEITSRSVETHKMRIRKKLEIIKGDTNVKYALFSRQIPSGGWRP